jgi:hypothetical protein
MFGERAFTSEAEELNSGPGGAGCSAVKGKEMTRSRGRAWLTRLG